MRFLPVNLDALMVELPDLPQTLALQASLRTEPIAGIEDIVPAARTLLVRYRPAAIAQRELISAISRRRLDAKVEQSGTLIEIPVRYDGEDLAEVADLLKISVEEVIRRHTGSDYTVAFTGFAPGFAYLSGGHPSFDLPRRATPRPRLAAGSVGLAGHFSAVYPQASPGGWQIIGVTDLPMWDLARERPALLQPGDRVRFVEAGKGKSPHPQPHSPQGRGGQVARSPLSPVGSRAGGEGGNPASPLFDVVKPSPQMLFQDLGRPGQARQGVSVSGAMDRAALRSANRLVGNPSPLPGIEIAYGGCELLCLGETVVAVTGAEGPLTLTTAVGSAYPVPRYAAIALTAGDKLHFGEPQAGMRSYLAVRGGFAVAPVLGSAATDTLAQIGPPAITVGDHLRALAPSFGAVTGLPDVQPTLPKPGEPVILDVVMGPRSDWISKQALEDFESQSWSVTPQSNRIGIRLAGERALKRAPASEGKELPSEGTIQGSIQVPPSGQPVLFLADHPLTGGYPVIAAVAPYHLDRAGQIPIGAQIRFRPITQFPGGL
ncbi:carboxyltransferase domain-containing protein [Labrys sedimenti]|uniref:5-oxoprolinase subunit B/C family protein n=1 Tax=Labrys sedimenti TaxID=3106036 RepID=UPI002ACAD15C|nr:carboxyltransferase domain-containing protein [Labrys sp. ZIDIC5]MDZ5449658.1 carboxyltransferase domain-containing protein [Labrys sp. ZIDIC5]